MADEMSAAELVAWLRAPGAIHPHTGDPVANPKSLAAADLLEALTSRAEKAEREVASFKRALEIEKGNTASAHDDYADLKREADRMRTQADAQAALLRDLIRETQIIAHETRDDGQILFVVRRLLGAGAQQAYLDEAEKSKREPSAKDIAVAEAAADHHLARMHRERDEARAEADRMRGALAAAQAMEADFVNYAEGNVSDTVVAFRAALSEQQGGK